MTFHIEVEQTASATVAIDAEDVGLHADATHHEVAAALAEAIRVGDIQPGWDYGQVRWLAADGLWDCIQHLSVYQRDYGWNYSGTGEPREL